MKRRKYKIDINRNKQVCELKTGNLYKSSLINEMKMNTGSSRSNFYIISPVPEKG